MDFRYYYITHWEKINACREKENFLPFLKSLSTLAIRHLFVVYANEKSHTVDAVWLSLAGIAGLRTVVFAEVRRMRSFTYGKTVVFRHCRKR